MSIAQRAAPASWPVIYPESDGKPMAETDVHLREMVDAIHTLRDYYRDRPDVYVAGNMLLYYEEGNPAASVAPDVFVVFGVPKGERRTFKLWEENAAPRVVIEFSSRSTYLEDRGNKQEVYRAIGVQEYFLFDPLEEYLDPPLQGRCRQGDELLRIPRQRDGSLRSEVLGLELRREGSRLRFVDPKTGTPLLSRLERADNAEQAIRAAEKARQDAEARAAEALTEVARLRALLERS